MVSKRTFSLIDYVNHKFQFIPSNFVFKFLKNATSPEMNIDGSVTPVNFDYVVPAGKVLWVERVNFVVINESMVADSFFGIADLANGLSIKVLSASDDVLIDFYDGLTIKTMVDFCNLAGADAGNFVNENAIAHDTANVRWTIAKAGEPMMLTAGEKFRITVSDDISDIERFRAMVQGVLVDE